MAYQFEERDGIIYAVEVPDDTASAPSSNRTLPAQIFGFPMTVGLWLFRSIIRPAFSTDGYALLNMKGISVQGEPVAADGIRRYATPRQQTVLGYALLAPLMIVLIILGGALSGIAGKVDQPDEIAFAITFGFVWLYCMGFGIGSWVILRNMRYQRYEVYASEEAELNEAN